MMRAIVFAGAAAVWIGCVASPSRASEVDPAVAAAFAGLSLPVPARGQAIICHGFNCKFRTPVVLGGGDRAQLAGLLGGGRATPVAERKAVASAVAWFDRRFARVAGIDKRVPRAGYSYAGDRGQLDCVDASSNTMSVLLLLADMNLLRHHSVDAPKSRGLVAIVQQPHTTAVLRELKGGKQWAVDSWTRKSGQLPDVMPLDVWVTLD
jgi:hypothetical protein